MRLVDRPAVTSLEEGAHGDEAEGEEGQEGDPQDQEGQEALALDLLVVNGDPLQDLRLLAEPDKNLVVIMKDGRVHKDTRAGPAPVMGSVIE